MRAGPGYVLNLPDWIAAMPTTVESRCPACGHPLHPPPKRARECESCGERFNVRACPDGVRRIVTPEAALEVDCLLAEQHAMGNVVAIMLTDSSDPAGNDRRWAELEQEVRARARAAVIRHHA